MTHSQIVAALKNDVEQHPDVYRDRQALRDRLAAGHDWRAGAQIIAERQLNPPDGRTIPGTPRTV